MAYKLTVLVALAAAATIDYTSSEVEIGSPYAIQLFHQKNSCSYLKTCTQEPDISTLWNQSISTVCATGIWFFYDHVNYNSWYEGKMTSIAGIDDCHDMDFAVRSFRYAGSQSSFDEESFTLYEGADYSGAVFHGSEDYSDFKADVKSIAITGASDWAFFKEPHFEGYGWLCFSTGAIATKGNKTLHGNFWNDLPNSHDWDYPIRSVKKGCPPPPVTSTHPVPVTSHHPANGVTGSFMMPKH